MDLRALSNWLACLDRLWFYGLWIQFAFQRARSASGFNPQTRCDLEWISAVNFEPEPLFADTMLRKDSGLMVVMTKRRDPSIVLLHLHAGHILASLRKSQLQMRGLNVARRAANATWKFIYVIDMALIALSRMTLAEFRHVGTPHEAQPCCHSVPNFLDFQPSQRAFSQASLKSDVSVSKTSGQESHSKTSFPYERSIIAATDPIQSVREFDCPNTMQHQ